MSDETTKGDASCRILVVGAQRGRVAKVVSLLQGDKARSPLDHDEKAVTAGLPQHLLLEHAAGVCVEYLSCVAKFGSYEDEDGTPVRYLASMDYYCQAKDGTLSSTPSSLATFFDEEQPENDEKLFHGIAGVVVGCGIEGVEDTIKIQTFLETMVSGVSSSKMPLFRTLQPSPPYGTMQEELTAYRLLGSEEKEEVSRQQTIGPGKMAKMARELAIELIQAALLEKFGKPAGTDDHQQGQEESSPTAQESPPLSTEEPKPHVIDTEKLHFKCRKCRGVLFGVADLENPAHEPSQHSFSFRKQHHGMASSSSCQSYFLQDSLSWMGAEGKFNCPFCITKLGSTTWSGAQCSCGTWVVPAIQIPKSKVDPINPVSSVSSLPPGTVVHRLAALNVASST